MKPCDCKNQSMVDELKNNIIFDGDFLIRIELGMAMVEYRDYVSFAIPVKSMKKFCEWFLRDQD